jgi:hypothetical protein
MLAFMAAPDFEATDANCHPSRDGEVLMAGANPAGRPFSISKVSGKTPAVALAVS